MELGEPDASGRRRPVPVAGSEYDIPCDTVIIALGTSPNPLIKDSFKALETAGKGTIVVDEDMMTNIDGVYAGGDAVTGAATVILAMGGRPQGQQGHTETSGTGRVNGIVHRRTAHFHQSGRRRRRLHVFLYREIRQ